MIIYCYFFTSLCITAIVAQAPRTEAVSILGAVLSFPQHCGDIPMLDPNSAELSIKHYSASDMLVSSKGINFCSCLDVWKTRALTV